MNRCAVDNAGPVRHVPPFQADSDHWTRFGSVEEIHLIFQKTKLPRYKERRCVGPLPRIFLDDMTTNFTSKLWTTYANWLYTRWEKTYLWDLVEPYRRPRSFKPLVSIYISAFYTGVIGSAITEQLYKERYWEDHPGEAVPLMQPKFYWGPWRVLRQDLSRPSE
ncbi:uncharacterized protein At4g29660 [Nymphaea colorata]|uniref:uncharacterized protein At4g29660 n=1 Tax=Nymphaea colorata TaxID=210225 RepID=UPI00129E3960|nr:uncharacterized protein At4g29660 [Nymphaea colorata]